MDTIWNESRSTSQDLSAKVGYGVKRGTTRRSCLLATAGACIGVIIQKGATNGEAITIMRKGSVEFAVADGLSVNIAIGDPLTTNGSGKWVKATTAGHMVVARAEQACTTDDTQIEIELIDAYPLPA